MVDRDEANKLIALSYRTIMRALDRLMLPRLIELGLTMPQFKALIAIVSAGSNGISVTELGHELSVAQPSASLIVDQLVRPGYVVRVRDTEDRRRVLVTPTALGSEMTAELRHGRAVVFSDWLASMSDEEAAALAIGMRALAAKVEVSPLFRPAGDGLA